MCPVAVDTCDGVAGVLRRWGVGITWPLAADIYQTKHSNLRERLNQVNNREIPTTSGAKTTPTPPMPAKPMTTISIPATNGHKAALVLSLLAFTAGMCPVAGDTCDGVAGVLRKREVAIVCPLAADVHQTQHSVVIKQFKQVNEAETVLGCDWVSYHDGFHCVQSRVGAELIVIHPDRVLARLPKDRLVNGTYRCQLVPPDRDDPFTDCTICDPEIPTTSGAKTTTSTPATRANDDYLSFVERNVTFITVTFVLLTVLGCIVILVYFYRKRKRLRDWWTKVTVHRRPGGVEDSHPTSRPVTILCRGSGNPSDPPQHEEGRPDRPQPDREANQTEGATSGQPLLNPPAQISNDDLQKLRTVSERWRKYQHEQP